ncbi:MAG: glycosyltransferase [[Clostridium] aminophilum]|uniref:glycosyltransferase n=1 Tax=[Clostridium] aminophilum TaxID=1526 RepID=UPI0026F2D03E|nr:glycosyltransferase [[Clostridium] aminophilum]MDD6195541.1 glycosyltransferase [[Clostridium] aminophilum]
MEWETVVRTVGFIMILLYFLCGIDDSIWFLYSFLAGIRYHRNGEDEELDFVKLRNTPPKMLAVTIAAWHEANVIGDVITNFLNTTDYPKSMYHLFVGVYPNDPDTISAVERMSRIYPNVHPVVNCQNGPTTKAQNINHVIRQIHLFEKERKIRFASLTVHDSEDVIHTYELLATNYLIDRHDALQFPVFPIMEMPRFSNFFRQITTATYADEFAENHYISLVGRRNLHAFVPCAGTGFAISGRRLAEFGDRDVLPAESLTEDYLLSLTLYKKGIPLHYVLNRLPRVMKNGKVSMDFLTTRSMFPNTFAAAVRQKTRWTYGITMQSVSMKDVFAANGVSFAGRYSFYKDLKAKVVNLIPIVGYLVSIYCLFAAAFGLEPLYREGTPVYYMAEAVFVMMIIRQIFRGYALFCVYGMRSVFFGCLLPPLFPIRLIYGNIINFAATLQAVRMKLFGEKRTGEKKTGEENAGEEITGGEKTSGEAGAAPEGNRKIQWAKTDHEFLNRHQLRRYRRMIGDVLICQGYLTAEQFRDCLGQVDKEHGEQIGEYLIRKKVITEEQMVRALAHVKHIQFIPDEVVRCLKLWKDPERFDYRRLCEDRIFPLTIENNTCIIGISSRTKEAAVEAFRIRYGLGIRKMYLTEHMIGEMIRQAETLHHKDAEKPAAPAKAETQDVPEVPEKADAAAVQTLQSSREAYYAGRISFEQLVLIGTYVFRLGKTEDEIRVIMGIG